LVYGFLKPMLYLLGQGLIVGLVVGFSVRKLNKVIAALIGVTILALNVLWFMHMLEIDIGFQLLNKLGDTIFRLLPFSIGDLKQELGPLLLVAIQAPFIGGFFLGLIAGFKRA